MSLREIAHSRAGDKGNLVNISVIAYRQEDYPTLVERVTVERVTELFRDTYHPARCAVLRSECYCPQLCLALGHLTDSVTRSLHLDAHGKSLSSLMLSLDDLNEAAAAADAFACS